jgi:hypothetical protein
MRLSLICAVLLVGVGCSGSTPISHSRQDSGGPDQESGGSEVAEPGQDSGGVDVAVDPCAGAREGTICRPGTCEGSTITNVYVCDGDGSCVPGSLVLCTPYSCDPATNQCFETCASDDQCSSGRCFGGSCGRGFDPAVCVSNDECRSGHCADGVCCNTACAGTCQACNLTGLLRTCSPISAGSPDPDCPTSGLCDGFGSFVDAGADGAGL